MREYFSLFRDLFDPQKTGYFTLQTVEATLIANGFLDEKTSVLSLLKYLEPDDTGKVPIEQVEALLHPEFVKLDDPANVQEMFEQFDRDQDQGISLEDLVETSKGLGFPLTKFQAEIMIKNFDSNHHGKLDLHDFKAVFR